MDDMILFTVLLAKGKVVLIIENYVHVFCLYSRKMSEMLPEERVCRCELSVNWKLVHHKVHILVRASAWLGKYL